jgi:hypothetical protein
MDITPFVIAPPGNESDLSNSMASGAERPGLPAHLST